MDQTAQTVAEVARGILPTAQVASDHPDAARLLAQGLGPGPFTSVVVFISPDADLPGLTLGLAAQFGDCPVIGCTTAGEISALGYTEGCIVAIGFPADMFAASTLLIEHLDRIDAHDLIGRMIRLRASLARARPDWEHEFAFLMVDGLSLREDELTATLASGLGPVPLFGGSAGDGMRFGQIGRASCRERVCSTV